MAAQNAEGIILRKYFLRETSLLLVVFTREFGKIKGVMKGVRAPYPQFAGSFELFSQCEMLFYNKKKKPLDLITQCNAIEFFLPIRKDIERLTYASYFIELIDMVTTDHDQNEELYDILLASLKMLASMSSPKRATRIFELKFLKAIGLSPEMKLCVRCGTQDTEKGVFSIESGGMVCTKCAHKEKSVMRISPGAVNFMNRILVSDLEKTQMIKVSKEVGIEIEKALKGFLNYHIARPLKSMKFLREMQKAGIC